MRVVLTGAADYTIKAANTLSEAGHEVILIEEDGKKVAELREQLDCGIIHGDGSSPEILQETNPKEVDFLFSLTDSDQDNIITGLVGKSLGFKKVIVSVCNTLYEKVCMELGLEHTIVPSRSIAHSLADFVENEDSPELKDYFKCDARLVKFVAEETCLAKDLDLPERSKAICFYRDEKFYLVQEDTELKTKDEVILLTSKKEVPALQKRFAGKS